MKLLPDIKKILYCTRIGPNSAYIYRHAMALAEKFDAAITVLHVMETLTPEMEALIDSYAGFGSTIHDVVEHEEQDAGERIRKHLNSFCSRLGDENSCSLRLEKIVVAEGHPAEEIVRHSVETGADIIVIGAHAQSSIQNALMGSTTQKVIKKASVPVYVVQVPEGEQEFTASGI